MPATETTFRKPSTMHHIFAASSLVLCVSVFWMMAADHDDQWREFQSEFYRLEAAKMRAEAKASETEEFNQNVDALKKKLQAAQEQLDKQPGKVGELTAKRDDLQNEVEKQERVVRALRAEKGVAGANYDIGIRDALGQDALAVLKADFDSKAGNVADAEAVLEEFEAERDDAANALADVEKSKAELQAELEELTADVDRLHASVATIEPKKWSLAWLKRPIMEWPIIDGFNSHMKVRQDWLPDLKVTIGMTRTARFDRCRTCHLGIDRTEAGGVPAFPHGELEDGEYPHPYASHPRLDLYLSANSPHPLQRFGCTSCHDGQGSGTSFSNAAHTPDNPVEAEEWLEELDYHSNHFWEQPMFTKTFRESACLKCHHNVIELSENREFGPTAPKLVKGWELVRDFGCFGCHEINGFAGGKAIGPDMRLEPTTEAQRQAIEADPNLIAGTLRKVGPSLEHIAQKTNRGWLEAWIAEPKAFRPSTRMPQFFDLSNQHDAHAQHYSPIEVAAMTAYLSDKSTDIKLDSWAEGYKPDAERGKTDFARRGCLACHTHGAFPDAKQKIDANFGPDLSDVSKKIDSSAEGQRWLYTWIRDPERYHPRTKMPDLYLDSTDGGKTDPAADIMAFLLTGDSGEYAAADFSNDENRQTLDSLVQMYLVKAAPKRLVGAPKGDDAATGYFKSRKYPLPAEDVKGDEIELIGDVADDDEWLRMKLNYVGRRTISQYGCFGCHDIPGFEKAQPIAPPLQDWGRKDPSKLAVEHVIEYLHHHGEPDGSSTQERVEEAIKSVSSGADPESNPQLARDLKSAARFASLEHHGRDGFIWQKLRAPRSYDHEKLGTKGYDERLRMPKFPFNEEQIEAISTFILGLVAEPPAEQYVYRPEGDARTLIEGEKLLRKYNCRSCHMTELPEITFAAMTDELLFYEGIAEDEFQEGFDLLMKLKPPRQGDTGEMRTLSIDEEEMTLPVVTFRGMVFAPADPEDDFIDQEWSFDLWETLKIGDELMLPGSKVPIMAPQLIDQQPARGGQFAEWLVDALMQASGKSRGARGKSWQMSPPTLMQEGIKVQTPWLYRFLLNPERIRHETVLRMPRFNMDPDEAQILANYFAAVDGTTYPYQYLPEREPDYLSDKNRAFAGEFKKKHDYLSESWKVLNAPLCIKCHSVGGHEFKASADANQDIRGPDLVDVPDRLRPEWLALWLYKPQWFMPYTSMPVNFSRSKPQFVDAPEGSGNGLFNGDGQKQVIGVRDALLNYYKLIERDGSISYEPPGTPAPAQETN